MLVSVRVSTQPKKGTAMGVWFAHILFQIRCLSGVCLDETVHFIHEWEPKDSNRGFMSLGQTDHFHSFTINPSDVNDLSVFVTCKASPIGKIVLLLHLKGNATSVQDSGMIPQGLLLDGVTELYKCTVLLATSLKQGSDVELKHKMGSHLYSKEQHQTMFLWHHKPVLFDLGNIYAYEEKLPDNLAKLSGITL